MNIKVDYFALGTEAGLYPQVRKISAREVLIEVADRPSGADLRIFLRHQADAYRLLQAAEEAIALLEPYEPRVDDTAVA